MAISERDQMAQKPIPIPPHRNSQGKSKGASQKPPQKQDRGDSQPKKTSKKPSSKGSGKKIAAGETMSLGGKQNGGEEE